MEQRPSLAVDRLSDLTAHVVKTNAMMDIVRDYVYGHRADINHGINDFGDLLPVLEWFEEQA